MLGHVSDNYWEVAPYVLELLILDESEVQRETKALNGSSKGVGLEQ